MTLQERLREWANESHSGHRADIERAAADRIDALETVLRTLLDRDEKIAKDSYGPAGGWRKRWENDEHIPDWFAQHQKARAALTQPVKEEK